MDPSYFVSTVQAVGGGVMAAGIFSVAYLVPFDHCLTSNANLNILVYHVDMLMTTFLPIIVMVSERSESFLSDSLFTVLS